MSTREIILDGGSPWGFRMHGGADVGQPLRISRVNPGSKAAQKGVREGDVISSINGQSTRNITNSDAHALLRNAGQTLHLGLNEECSGSPKRRLHRNIQESKSEAIKRTTVTRTTTATSRNSTVSINGGTDPNCNNTISTKDDGRQGKQNGGLKENTNTSQQDSKGARRRRRQQNTNLQVPSSDVKEDSDAVPEKVNVVSAETGNGKNRRRRRSRGSRRKCRAIGVESGSGSEQKTVSQDEKEVSVTERETDSALSDFGGKGEEKITCAVEESCQVNVSNEVTMGADTDLSDKITKSDMSESGNAMRIMTDSRLEIAGNTNVLGSIKQCCEVKTTKVNSNVTLTESSLQTTDSTASSKVLSKRRKMLAVESRETKSLTEDKCESKIEKLEEISKEFDKRKEINSKRKMNYEVKSTTIKSRPETGNEFAERKIESEVIIRSENTISTTEVEKNEQKSVELSDPRKYIKTEIVDTDFEIGIVQELHNEIEEENKIRLTNENRNENSLIMCSNENDNRINVLAKSEMDLLEVNTEIKSTVCADRFENDTLVPSNVDEIIDGITSSSSNKEIESDIIVDKVVTVSSVILEGSDEVMHKHSIGVTESTSTEQVEEISKSIGSNTLMKDCDVGSTSFNNHRNKEETDSEIDRKNSENDTENLQDTQICEVVDESEKMINITVTKTNKMDDIKICSDVQVISNISVESSCGEDIESTCILNSERRKPLEEALAIDDVANKNKISNGPANEGNENFEAEILTEMFESSNNSDLIACNLNQGTNRINSEFESKSETSESSEGKLGIYTDEHKKEIGEKADIESDSNYKMSSTAFQKEIANQLSENNDNNDVILDERKEANNIVATSEEKKEVFLSNEDNYENDKTFSGIAAVTENVCSVDTEVKVVDISDDIIEYIDSAEHPVLSSDSTEKQLSNSSEKTETVSNIETENQNVTSEHLLNTTETSQKEEKLVECKALLVITQGEELWEEVEEFGEVDVFYDARDELSENMESGFLLNSNTTALLHDSSKLSEEDKELLDPHPLIEAEEEETLRKFLNSLNLADYSKEAVNARNALLQDPTGKSVEEMYATRKDKRRNLVEAYPPSYSQQRGLDVILEENSSDCSDGERRGEEAKISDDQKVIRRNRAWEEAVYIPETNEVVFLTRDSDEGDRDSTGSEQGSSRNSGVFYSETSVTSNSQGIVEGSSYVYKRTKNESRTTRIISEEVSIDVFSEDMENALENALECEEVESEGSRRDDEEGDVKVELADTSDEEEHVEGIWRRGKARQRQDGVEIVYLDDDSGSTSSGMKISEDGAEDADVEEDPDVMYESDEFLVIGRRDAGFPLNKENSGGSSDSIYENVEFVNQKMTFLKNTENVIKKKDSDVCSDSKSSILSSDETSAIYENVVFFKRQSESLNSEVSSASTLREDNGNNLSHLPDNYSESFGKDSEMGGEINLLDEMPEKQNNETKEQANYKTITDSTNLLLEPGNVDTNENKPTPYSNSDVTGIKSALTVTSQITEITAVTSEYPQVSAHTSPQVPENSDVNYVENTANVTAITDVDSIVSVVQDEKIDTNNSEILKKELSIKIAPLKNSVDTDKDTNENSLSTEDIENHFKGNDISKSNEVKESKETLKNTLEVNDSDSDYKTPSRTPEPAIAKQLTIITDKGHVRNNDEIFEDFDSITPTNRSRHGSSSSDAGSHGTAFYCPSGFSPVSSEADISSFAEELENKTLKRRCSPLHFRKTMSRSRSHENISDTKKSLKLKTERSLLTPKSLKEICIEKVIFMPYGSEILRILGISVMNRDKQNVIDDIKDAVHRMQLLNLPAFSSAYKYMAKPPLSGSLPDLSTVKLEMPLRGGGDREEITQASSNAVISSSSTQSVQPPQSLAGSQWLGMPTKEDPNLFICLSPSQKQSYHQGEDPTPEEAENLLDLHRKFIHRRGYHEALPPPPPDRKFFGIRHCYNQAQYNFPQRAPSQPENKVNEKREMTSTNIIPSPRFRAVLTSLDSKIHTERNTGETLGGSEEKRDKDAAEKGASTPEGEGDGCSRSRSSSRLLAILRAVSSDPGNNVEFQPPSSSSSSAANSPPPLPPLPNAYQNQLEMFNFIHQQGKRPSTICCTTYDDFDYVIENGSKQSPSSYSQKSNNKDQNANVHSPSLKLKDVESNKTSYFSNNTEEKKVERIHSWYGQDQKSKVDKERLRVKSLSDWLQLVRCGGFNKDDDDIRSVDSTPPRSACLSTQSSPGPVRRTKDPPPRPEVRNNSVKEQNGMKEYEKLKQQIIQRRFSLPEKQLEETYESSVDIIKPPLITNSPRDDERHEQQLRLLHQRQQQRLRNQQAAASKAQQQLQEKRPPLPQAPKHTQLSTLSSDDTKAKSLQEENNVRNSQERTFHEILNSFQEAAKSQQSQSQRFKEVIDSLQEEQSKIQEIKDLRDCKLEENKYLKSQNERKFDAEVYRISKKGDIAIINNSTTRTLTSNNVVEEEKIQKEIKMFEQSKSSTRPKSMPVPTEALVTGGEIFRQQMYNEYMDKVAERAERRRQKVIRLSSAPRDDAGGKQTDAAECTATALQLENEFMGRVRARMDKLGLNYDEESDDGKGEAEVGEATELPKHLQEFLVITGGAGTDSEVNSDVDGVWSPQKSSLDPSGDPNNKEQEKRKKEEEDAPAVVWTPKSAGASPTAERKEFRPINFESPKLQRKNRSGTSTPTPTKPDNTQQSIVTSSSAQESTTTTTFSSAFPPWQQPLSSFQQQHSRDDSTVSVGSTIQSPTSEKSVASSTISSTIDRRLVQSQSAPASGLSALASSSSSNIKLPRAQNPTITLLQKAREGQLPRGALYLDHKMNSKEGEKPYISPNEILYSVKKEYESDGEQRKKIVELGPRKFEGIGPMTKEGIPIVLRSEVKDTNQAKWYKRMYDSLHRAGKDDDYVTIRYKPRRGHYPYTAPGGYLSEPEPACYDSDIGYSAKYATLDRRRIKNKENDFTTSTLPRSRYVPHPTSIKYATEVYKNQPGRIEDYEPGHSSISEKETKQWWDEVLDIFDGQASAEPRTTPSTPSNKPFMAYALKESGYESDSTLVFKRRDENQCQLSPAEQKLAYKTIQKGGEVPLHGLRKPAPERPKEPVYGPVPPRSYSPRERATSESPHRYVESEVTIHYRSPVRSEAKEALSEEELARRQAEAMRRIYQEERRRKYLQELQDMHSRRHTDNFTPSQKSPIPLNRYDDFLDDVGNKGKSRDRTPEPKLVARALYNFVGQTSRELSFRRGDIIFVRRQIDKNWYEGEHNAMIGLFPFSYVEIIPYDGIRTIPKKPSEGQARAKFNFIAQTHLELSLVKGELVVLTRRVDDNWFEGRIGNRKGIFPVSYVEVLSEPGEKPVTPIAPSTKPITLPASHTVLMNGSGIKQSMGQHSFQPSSYFGTNKKTSAYTSSNPYATLPRQTLKQPLAPINQLHIDTHSEPVPYRALYNYRPQNEDELELCEGDTVYVMEKCDDGWYVGSSQRTGYFGTFPGNYVERI